MADGTIRARIRLIAAIMSADYILIGGGGLLDDRSPSFFRPYARVAQLARVLRKPYSLVAVGVGPIRHATTAQQYRKIADGARAVLVRDSESAERLRECGVTRAVDVVSDPALWRSVQRAGEIPRFDAAVNLRCWEDREGRITGLFRGGLEGIVNEVAEALNQVYSADSSIALVSMSCLDGDDDSVALDLLDAKLDAITSKFYDCSLESVESVVSSSRQVISMRLHLCLIGVASGKPVVGIGYDPKIAQQGGIYGFRVVELDGSFSSHRVSGAITEPFDSFDQSVQVVKPGNLV